MLCFITLLFGAPPVLDPPILDVPPSAIGEVPIQEKTQKQPDESLPVTEPETRAVLLIQRSLAPLTDAVSLELEIESASARKIRERLLESSQFNITSSSPYRARLLRIHPKAVELTVFDRAREISRSVLDWPVDEEAVLNGRGTPLVFRERQGELDSESKTPAGFDPYFNPSGRLSWSRNGFAHPSQDRSTRDWSVLHEGLVLDDLELALLVGDNALADRIESERSSTRAWWRWGFGSASLAAAGSGAFFLATADERSSREVLGGSLLGVAALCAALVLFDDELNSGHVLSRGEAKTLVQRYNDRLD